MSYLKIIFIFDETKAELIAEALIEIGALSVSMEDAEQQELFQLGPNETPLWNNTKINALFPEKTSVVDIIEQLKKQFNFPDHINYQIEELVEQDWVRQTQKNFPARCFANQLWVCPSWEKCDALPGKIVRIDPGLAFGTGTHATTALCLQWLAENPPEDKEMIDYGCGSGILSLAALALGARKVWAVDHDPQALEATFNNAAINDFVSRDNLKILQPEQLPELSVPLVIANILAKPLIELAPTITKLVAKPGLLILSGILAPEVTRVLAAYQENFRMSSIVHATENLEWVRIVLHKG